jgi:exodeoxyribonuclease VII small subunit
MARSNTTETQPAPTAASPAGEMKFEAALAELEQIVATMEGGRLPLEESLDAYRRGTELLKHCQQQLGAAEHNIRALENGTLQDFEPASGDPR